MQLQAIEHLLAWRLDQSDRSVLATALSTAPTVRNIWNAGTVRFPSNCNLSGYPLLGQAHILLLLPLNLVLFLASQLFLKWFLLLKTLALFSRLASG